MAQFPTGEGNLFVLKGVWTRSVADHCHSSHPEVKNECNVTSVLPYVVLVNTETTLLPTTTTFCEILKSVCNVCGHSVHAK